MSRRFFSRVWDAILVRWYLWHGNNVGLWGCKYCKTVVTVEKQAARMKAISSISFTTTEGDNK